MILAKTFYGVESRRDKPQNYLEISQKHAIIYVPNMKCPFAPRERQMVLAWGGTGRLVGAQGWFS